jgi:anti-sigma factor RsiW
MCNKEQLVGYVYGELSVFEKAAFESHLRECAECRTEVRELGQTRQHLAEWTPPEPEFTYRMVKTPRAETGPAARMAYVPGWVLAAAAAVVLVAGAAAVANLEVRYGHDGSVIVRTGWGATAAESSGSAQPGQAQAAVSSAASEQTDRQLRALERRLDELQAMQSAQVVRATGGRQGISAPELRRILAESETRQRAEMAVYVAQIWKDFNAMRASDLARVQQTLGQAQGLTNLQLRQQRDTIDSLRYLHSVSQQK